MQELLKRGRESVPPLADALGRREPDLRVQAFEVLKRIVPAPLQFDPFATDDIRDPPTLRVAAIARRQSVAVTGGRLVAAIDRAWLFAANLAK